MQAGSLDGPWKTVYERHRMWAADGTWEQLLQQVQAEADAAGDIDWDVSVDSTVVRAHQHAAGARTTTPAAGKRAVAGELQDEPAAWTGLLDLLAEVVGQVKGSAAPAAASPRRST